MNSTGALLGTVALVGALGAAGQAVAAELMLPVPKTFDLTHAEAKHYAIALGKDPVRIFEFLRDQIGYEAYTGVLRGPRGTLLAMAGNSVDRAALLASLLKESGQRVRFARGTLSQPEARRLVESMWSRRVRPSAADGQGERSPALKASLDTLVASVKRDYTLIRDQLKKANIAASAQSVPTLDALVDEARDHYWVQWWKDNTWVDLDPSFPDAAPGRKYASSAGTTLDALPDSLYHRVAISVQLEEYTGDAPSKRKVLAYAAPAADLSGVDIVLSHQPENWKGPVSSLSGALASAIGNTGRVKPVLLIGQDQWVAGEPFRQKPPSGRGIGGIGDMLSGAGTRNPVPIATAETLEVEFVYPGGRKEMVVREIFDVVGKARRQPPARNLSAAEVRARSEAKTATDVTLNVYDLFFSTGRLDSAQVGEIVDKQPDQPGKSPSIRNILKRTNIAFTAVSDAMLPGVGTRERAVILFFPDSPRVLISEIATAAGRPRLSLDLRRYDARAVAMGPRREDAFSARVLRGVVNGTLEQTLLEIVTADARNKGWSPVTSTSSILGRAQASDVPLVLLTKDRATVAGDAPEDTRARILEELANGNAIVSAGRAVAYDDRPRFAWWRIDTRSGDTLGITDEGLHQVAVEYHLTRNETTAEVEVEVYVNTNYQYTESFNSFPSGIRDLGAFIRYLEQALGATPIDSEIAGAYRFFSGVFP